jgi:hypothetical protein
MLDAAKNVGNGPGSRVKSVAAQLIPYYRKIIWAAGNKCCSFIGDGLGGNSQKSDDFALLFEFMDTHPNDPGLYITGDHLAWNWKRESILPTPSLNDYISFNVLRSSYYRYTGDIAPTIGPGPSPILPPRYMLAYGGCPLLNGFDVLEATGSTMREMEYPNGEAAVLLHEKLNSMGSVARVALSGFSFYYIRETTGLGQPMPIRAYHLQDILTWFQNIIPGPTGISLAPLENKLENNFPNPFNPMTTINYSIKARGHVSLKIYDALGRLVKTLVNEEQPPKPGGYTATWGGSNNAGNPVSSGVYFYRLKTKGFMQTKKMVLIK